MVIALPFGIQLNSLNPIPVRMYKIMAIEFGRLQELQPLLALFPLRAKLRRAPDSVCPTPARLRLWPWSSDVWYWRAARVRGRDAAPLRLSMQMAAGEGEGWPPAREKEDAGRRGRRWAPAGDADGGGRPRGRRRPPTEM